MSILRTTAKIARRGLALLALVWAYDGAFAQSEITVLSSRPDAVSGGDAVVQVRVPPNVSPLQVVVLRNGVDVTSAFVATDLTTLQGLVSGLNVGANVILAKMRSDGSILTKALVANWPIYGPIFAGPHQRPWICETAASGLGPPPATGPCVAPTRYDWFYRTTAGTFAPLPSLTPPFPADLSRTTTIDGNTVNYIVRVESGVIDESIYRIAIIDDPTNPISNPWSPGGKKPGRGWNNKLVYPFGPGAGPGFRSGSNFVTSALLDGPLSLGFAVAFGTRNTYGTGSDDVISAETTMMIKDRFIKQYGLPKFTIATGSSGGSIQQHYIAQNYPGLLDAITPNASFPDLASIAVDVLDCQVLGNYFDQNTNPAAWPGSRRALIDGYALGTQSARTTCQNGWNNFSNRWQNPTAGFSDVVPTQLRYDPITNRSGARADYWDANVNSFGRDPATGFARSPYDNIGIQYGLNALNSGGITKAEFLDLNEKIGGLDIDGNYVQHRSMADPIALRNAYQSGRVVTSGEGLTLPIIDIRPYVDSADTGQLSIHSRIRTFMFLDRLGRSNGTIANHVNWITGGISQPDLATVALLAHNDWLEHMLADHSDLPYATKVILNEPEYLKDACWYDGVKYEETLTLDPSAKCNQLMPVYGTVRLAAGGSLGGTTLKCQLKPVTVTDYTASFTPAELVRLNTIFPQGVCDWSKPGVAQQAPTDWWLRFLPEAGTWNRMGHSSFGND
ncbi:MAG: hypothetical protein E6H66_25250 [Betaproteobacteria bacterium]|nr:MAG: hypothetical protein E6H66_25250 [Betaproteobacteria bacterium]